MTTFILVLLFPQPIQGINEPPKVHLIEIPASEILAKIQNGISVNYDHVTIIGDLNLSQLNQLMKHVERTQYEKQYLGVSENATLISSTICINNSTILGNAYFNDTIFDEKVVFNDTRFEGNANFAGSIFNKGANFEDTVFEESASFACSQFNQTEANGAHLISLQTSLTKSHGDGDYHYHNSFEVHSHVASGVNTNFTAVFLNPVYANFSSAFLNMGYGKSINNLWQLSLPNSAADFQGSKFEGTITFENSEFNGPAEFDSVHFNDISTFENSEFNGIAIFSDVNFNSTVNFGGAKFKKLTLFEGSVFRRIGKLVILKSKNPRYLGYTDINKSDDLWFWDPQLAADFWGSYFDGPVDFDDSTFNGSAFFRKVKFGGIATFTSSKFNGVAYFGGSEYNGPASFADSNFNTTTNPIDFEVSEFNATINHLVVEPKMSGYISYTDLNRPSDLWFWDPRLAADFRNSHFKGSVDFWSSNFNGASKFEGSAFNGSVDFLDCNFRGPIDLENSIFSSVVTFNNAKFYQKASLNGSRFEGDVFFLNTSFDNILYLTMTNYDKFYIKWTGISDLGYDDTSYLLLIQNFKKLGFFDDADKCYFQYEKELREQSNCPLSTQLFNRLQELLYGYGVSWLNSILSSVFLILAFGVIWAIIDIFRPASLFDLYRSEKYFGKEFARNITLAWCNKSKALSLEHLIFSWRVFFSGTQLFVDPPERPKLRGKWSDRAVSCIFTSERILGAMLFFLFILTISRTVIR
jgi:Pentapeptide repeats (9 copies)